MKVYVITKGSYSDYSIYGVAVNKEMAETLRKHVSDRYEDANIEEYDTDEYKPLTEGKKPYAVALNENGICRALYEVTYDIHDCKGKVRNNKQKGETMYTVYLWATDEEHALKIARDKIAEYKYRKGIDEQ